MKTVMQFLCVVIIAPLLAIIMILICLLNLFLYFVYNCKAELNINDKKQKKDI